MLVRCSKRIYYGLIGTGPGQLHNRTDSIRLDVESLFAAKRKINYATPTMIVEIDIERDLLDSSNLLLSHKSLYGIIGVVAKYILGVQANNNKFSIKARSYSIDFITSEQSIYSFRNTIQNLKIKTTSRKHLLIRHTSEGGELPYFCFDC